MRIALSYKIVSYSTYHCSLKNRVARQHRSQLFSQALFFFFNFPPNGEVLKEIVSAVNVSPFTRASNIFFFGKSSETCFVSGKQNIFPQQCCVCARMGKQFPQMTCFLVCKSNTTFVLTSLVFIIFFVCFRVDCLWKVARAEGIQGLYKGEVYNRYLQPNL